MTGVLDKFRRVVHKIIFELLPPRISIIPGPVMQAYSSIALVVIEVIEAASASICSSANQKETHKSRSGGPFNFHTPGKIF